MCCESFTGNTMTTILLTGFGPFPGAPHNPTEALVMELASRRHPMFANARRIAHVFRVSYEAVDRELPALIAREKPDALIMFGLATRAKTLRVEICARNVISRRIPDAGGFVPITATIASDASAERSLRAPAQRLVMAARRTGVPVALSRNAGSYLCNYLCWQAAALTQGPRLATFVHVPLVRGPRGRRSPWSALTFDDLTRAGGAIMRAALTAVRTSR
jgi:pyroglutamyl-peptidase